MFLDDSLGVVWQVVVVFFFSLQKCKFSVEGGLFRTRCRALEHGFDNLQGGLSVAQIDVHLK